MNRDVGSITLDHVYDSLLKTSHSGKETTIKLREKKQWSELVVIKSSSHDDET